MTIQVLWTTEAEDSFDEIFNYLSRKWSQNVAQDFALRVNELIEIISKKPHIFKRSKSKLVHQDLVTKQVSLFYLVREEQLILLSFWDNRQDPEKIDY